MSGLVAIHYTPRNEVVWAYTGFTMSVRLSVRPSVDKSYVVRVLLLESSLKRHVTSKREYHKDKMAGLSR